MVLKWALLYGRLAFDYVRLEGGVEEEESFDVRGKKKIQESEGSDKRGATRRFRMEG